MVSLQSLCAIILLTVLATANPAVSQTKDSQCQYQAGFQILSERDLSRPSLSPSEIGRWMQIAVWYPTAAPPRTQPLAIKDLVALSSTDVTETADDTARSKAVESFIDQSMKAGASRELTESLLNLRTHTHANAKPASGKFPLILFLHSSPPGENLIAEKLAQCEFVVASVVSKGTAEPQYSLSFANIQTMITDAAFALNAVRRLPFVHPSSLGIIGMSNGALSALLLHARNPQVRAIVSLDGTIGEEVAEKVFAKDPYYDPLLIRCSILHLYTTNNPNLKLDTLMSFRNAERYLVTMPTMRHWDFLSFGAYETIAPGIMGTPISDHAKGFEYSLLFTTQFLKAHLQDASDANRFLSDALSSNPAPDWIGSIEQLRAQPDVNSTP